MESNRYDLNQYQEQALRTANNDLPQKVALTYGALKLAGEAGEVAEVIGKYIGQGHELDCGKVLEELGDVLWYVSYLSALLTVGLDEIAEINIEKLKKRYPDGFDPEMSIRRLDKEV